jgi:ElaB/YqjD/DUF883 family membrane-anchored ribosome-binding protein
MKPNGGRRPDEILAEIDRTRGEMDRTLSAIEQRLTPGQLVDQGLSYFRESGANEFVQNLGGAAKNNPLPVALVGIGLTWLMALGRQPAQHQGFGAYDADSSGPGMREKASGMLRGVSDRLSSAKQQLSDKAGSVREGASSGMSSMRDSAGAGMSSVRERASQLTGTAREQWQRARGGIDYMIHEQPLALGAIGVAIGAMLAAAAPRTRKEQELMGEASRDLVQKTKEAAAPHLEQAKETAKQAVETVTSGMKSKADGQAQHTPHAAVSPTAAQAAQTLKEPQSSGTTAAPPATPTGPRPPRQSS